MEIRAFFGVLLIAAALHCQNKAISEMWSTEKPFAVLFLLLSWHKIDLLTYFSLLDLMANQRVVIEKQMISLQLFARIWDGFVKNCKKLFEPFEEVTVEKQLVAFRGKCPMRQYMKSKPARPPTYLYNLQVHTGRLPGNAPEKNQERRVVCDMMKPLFGGNA